MSGQVPARWEDVVLTKEDREKYQWEKNTFRFAHYQVFGALDYESPRPLPLSDFIKKIERLVFEDKKCIGRNIKDLRLDVNLLWICSEDSEIEFAVEALVELTEDEMKKKKYQAILSREQKRKAAENKKKSKQEKEYQEYLRLAKKFNKSQ
jgi:hypothetical protein